MSRLKLHEWSTNFLHIIIKGLILAIDISEMSVIIKSVEIASLSSGVLRTRGLFFSMRGVMEKKEYKTY